MKLSETTTQLSKGKESSLIITVNYCPEKRDWESIVSVQVYNGKAVIDITSIMSDVYDAALDSMMDQIDWNKVYLDSQPEPEPEEKDHLRPDLYQYDMAKETNNFLANIYSSVFK